MEELLKMLKEQNVTVNMKGDIIIIRTKDVEYRIYDEECGLFSGTVRPLYADGELFSRRIDVKHMLLLNLFI